MSKAKQMSVNESISELKKLLAYRNHSQSYQDVDFDKEQRRIKFVQAGSWKNVRSSAKK